MQTKKNIFLWTSYDFANSIISITFFLYFAQWIVIDKGIPDLFYNLVFTISAILLFFTVPLTGVLLDKSLRRIAGLRITTITTFVLLVTCALFTISDRPILALIAYTAGFYSYLLTFTFYTPLLNDIASENKRGKISGYGISANYLGQVAGLLIALPFATGALSIFGSNTRAETLLPAVIMFLLFSLPMLIFFKEPKKAPLKFLIKDELKNTIKEVKSLLLVPSVGLFLLAFFLFNDAILTSANNFSIFLEQVWHVSDTIKTFILLGILVTSAIGGTLGGIIADKVGHKRTLMFILLGWVIILPLVGLLTNFALFVVVTTIMGFWFGANWAVSRSVMAYLAPSGKHNLAFGFYGLAERASSVLGPVIWGLVVGGLVSMGSVRYKIALVSVTIFIILGLIVFSRVRSDRARV